MYKTIYIPVDNSDHSNQAVDTGVHLAKLFGSKIVGSHVYAAKMHDKRFKQMEAGLPEEYHDEKELDRQRQIHDSLITRGLQIITDSYLDYVDKKCNEANLPIERRSLEGRNWKVLAEDINTNSYDLVIMGALGVGAVKDSVIGSGLPTKRLFLRPLMVRPALPGVSSAQLPACTFTVPGRSTLLAADDVAEVSVSSSAPVLQNPMYAVTEPPWVPGPATKASRISIGPLAVFKPLMVVCSKVVSALFPAPHAVSGSTAASPMPTASTRPDGRRIEMLPAITAVGHSFAAG